jgi:hypothetical protein
LFWIGRVRFMGLWCSFILARCKAGGTATDNWSAPPKSWYIYTVPLDIPEKSNPCRWVKCVYWGQLCVVARDGAERVALRHSLLVLYCAQTPGFTLKYGAICGILCENRKRAGCGTFCSPLPQTAKLKVAWFARPWFQHSSFLKPLNRTTFSSSGKWQTYTDITASSVTFHSWPGVNRLALALASSSEDPSLNLLRILGCWSFGHRPRRRHSGANTESSHIGRMRWSSASLLSANC